MRRGGLKGLALPLHVLHVHVYWYRTGTYSAQQPLRESAPRNEMKPPPVRHVWACLALGCQRRSPSDVAVDVSGIHAED